MKASLDGANARIDRAKKHIRDIDRQSIAIGEAHPPGKLNKPNAADIIQAPPVFGILVGEVTYNLRAALDYLAYELAILNTGGIVEGTQFPIEDSEESWESSIKRRVSMSLRHLDQ